MVDDKIEDLGADVFEYLRNGPVPDCLGAVLVSTEGTDDDFMIRVTPSGMVGPLGELINLLVYELSQRVPENGFIEEIVTNYIDSIPKEVKSDA